jgi:hypothetical protein
MASWQMRGTLATDALGPVARAAALVSVGDDDDLVVVFDENDPEREARQGRSAHPKVAGQIRHGNTVIALNDARVDLRCLVQELNPIPARSLSYRWAAA